MSVFLTVTPVDFNLNIKNDFIQHIPIWDSHINYSSSLDFLSSVKEWRMLGPPMRCFAMPLKLGIFQQPLQDMKKENICCFRQRIASSNFHLSCTFTLCVFLILSFGLYREGDGTILLFTLCSLRYNQKTFYRKTQDVTVNLFMRVWWGAFIMSITANIT